MIEITSLLQAGIPLFTVVFAIYKFRKEMLQRTAILNFEQIRKYFVGKELENLKELPNFAQDMACETVSYFRGNKFTDLEEILKANFHLEDLINILKLSKAKIITYDAPKKKVEISKKYLNKKFIKWAKTARGYEIWNWIFFLVYIGILVILATTFVLTENGLGFVSVMVLVGVWEIPMLIKIEQRKSVEWFQTEGIEQISKAQKERLESFINSSSQQDS